MKSELLAVNAMSLTAGTRFQAGFASGSDFRAVQLYSVQQYFTVRGLFWVSRNVE